MPLRQPAVFDLRMGRIIGRLAWYVMQKKYPKKVNVPSAYQNRVILYPPDILENGNYAIIHELSHVLNDFYHKASQPWESTLIAEGFAEYNTYKTIQWIEKNDLALAYAVGTSNQVLLNTMLNAESA